MRTLLTISLAACCVSVPAYAAANEPKKDKVVCKRGLATYNTGTRLSGPSRVCMKESEWEEREQQTQQNLRTIKDRGVVLPVSPEPAMSSSPL